MNDKELENLKNILTDILITAPAENDCTEKENEIYADIQKLQENITEYFEIKSK